MIRKAKPGRWHYVWMALVVIAVMGVSMFAAGMTTFFYVTYQTNEQTGAVDISPEGLTAASNTLGFLLGAATSIIWIVAMIYWTGIEKTRRLIVKGTGLAVTLGIACTFITHTVYSNIDGEWQTSRYLAGVIIAVVSAAVLGGIASAIWAALPVRPIGEEAEQD